jgi:hypothetical protein
VLNDRAVKATGLTGSRLKLRLAGKRLSISYRTPAPKTAKAELVRLLQAHDRKIDLTAQGRSYVEYYVALDRYEALLVRAGLPGSRLENDPSLERDGVETLYAQRLLIQVGQSAVHAALVMYRRKPNLTPECLKLEIRATVDLGRRLIPEAARNRVVGFLRHCLDRALVVSVAKPARWIGTPFNKVHTDGTVQRRIRQILHTQASATMEFERLVKALRKFGVERRGNITQTLKIMERVGDVDLVWNGKAIREVRLFDYSSIGLIAKS